MRFTDFRHSPILRWLQESPRLPSIRSTIWPLRVTAEQQRSLLRLIGFAVEHEWPLPPLLDAKVQDERGTQRRKIRRLIRLLRNEVSLPDALERVPAAVSPQAALAVRLGLAAGLLPEMLRAFPDTGAETTPNRQRLRWTWWYLGGMTLAIMCVWSFSIVNLQPILLQIAGDLGVAVPIRLQWASTISAGAAAAWPLLLLALALLVWWVASGRLDRSLHFGWLAPLSGRTLMLRAAELLTQLRIIKEHGRPVAGALSTLARYHYDPAFRPRLLFVRNELEQQADTWDSMRRAGLISSAEARVLASSEPLGNTAWALQQLAQRKRSAMQRRAGMAVEFFRVAAVLSLGAIVWLFTTGNFSMLPAYIQGM